LWYRAVILEVIPTVDQVKVRFVDYGNEELLPITELRQIPMTFLVLPKQIIPVEVEELKSEFESKVEEFCQKVQHMQENWAVLYDVSLFQGLFYHTV
jgi:hypothetical protein